MTTPASNSSHPLRPLLWTLAIFSLVEFVLLRFAGAMSFQNSLAGGGASGSSLSPIGSFFLDASTVLALVCLATFALTPIRWRTGWSFVFVAYVVLGAVLPWATAVGHWVPSVYGLISACLTLVVGMVAIFQPTSRGTQRFATSLLLLAYVCSYMYSLSPTFVGYLSTVAPGGPGTLGFGEVLFLLAGVFVFWAWGWERVAAGSRLATLGGFIAAVCLGGFLGFGGPSAAAAVTSATGLTLFLPAAIYVLSTFFFATTAFACILDKHAFATGAALLMFLFAGLLAGSSYQQALLLLGFTLLAHGERAFASHAPNDSKNLPNAQCSDS